MVAGHTKNSCDASFGCVKRGLKAAKDHMDIYTPADMFEIMEKSFPNANAVVVRPCEVTWIDFKEFFQDQYNGVIDNLRVQHLFEFARYINVFCALYCL